MSSQTRIRLGAVSAIFGGGFWVVKGVAILLTGVQPPLLFELAPVLFAAGLVGIHARASGNDGPPGVIGLLLAVASGVLAVVSLVVAPPTSTGESFSPVIFGSFLANLGALIFLGIVTRRTRSLPGRWRFLPLAMGISTFPLMAVGGALESINERLLEPPLVLLGLAWMGIGYLLWSSAKTRIVAGAAPPDSRPPSKRFEGSDVREPGPV